MDLILTGMEASLWVVEQFALDLKVPLHSCISCLLTAGLQDSLTATAWFGLLNVVRSQDKGVTYVVWDLLIAC